MPEDIETLLRDAGRSPTRQLDVEQVHQSGRRRARTRHVATGVGVVAVLAVAAVGVTMLQPTTTPPPVMEQPPEDPAPAPSDQEQVDQDGIDEGIDQEEAPTTSLFGTTVASVTQDDVVQVTLTAPNGRTTSFGVEVAAYDHLAASVVLDGDGNAIVSSATGDLVRGTVDGTTVLATGDTADGTPWLVHGTTDGGEVLVSRLDPTDADELLLVRGDELVPWPGQPVLATLPEERFDAVSAVGDRLLVSLLVGDSVRWLLYDGAAAPVEALSSSTMPFDDVPYHPTLVGEELWYLETQASDALDGTGPQDLVVRVGDDVRRLPTPYGRQVPAFVGAVSVGTLGDGGPALLLSSIARDGDAPGAAFLVDLDAARRTATASGGERIPNGVFEDAGTTGTVRFVP